MKRKPPSTRRRARLLEKRRRSHGDNPRVRWTGRNFPEIREFASQHGGTVEWVVVGENPPLVYLVSPYRLIGRGAWLERVPEFEPGDERGWRTWVT